MPKSPDAFRTISEVADWLGIQAHVLRFWESKFTQVKPVKRAGGRRYYRPADMQLLGGIKKLLHEDGLTIKGVQKILREEGMGYVAALSMPLDDAEGDVETVTAPTPAPAPPVEPEAAVVLPFGTPKAEAPSPVAEPDAPEVHVTQSGAEPQTENRADAQEEVAEHTADAAPQPSPDQMTEAEPEEVLSEAAQDADTASPAQEDTLNPEPALQEQVQEGEQSLLPEAGTSSTSTLGDDPADSSEPVIATSEPEVSPQPQEAMPQVAASPETAPQAQAPAQELPTAKPLPAFMRKPEPQDSQQAAASQPQTPQNDAARPGQTPQEEPPSEPAAAATEPASAPAPKPRDIPMPVLTPESEIHAQAAVLTRTHALRQLDAQTAREIAPLLSQLAALHDRMQAKRDGAHPKS